MKNFDDFIDQIIKDKGFDTEEPEVINQLKADIGDSLENRINAMIVTNIPEDKIEEFAELTDTNDADKIQKYLHNVIPDLDQKIALEMAQFRAYYLG